MRSILSSTAPLVLLVLTAAGLTPGQPAGQPQAPREARALPPAAKSFRFPKAPQVETPDRKAEEPPIRLTASDGTGLALVALEVNGLLQPPLAFTELHLTFENPRDRVIEGRFRIALPPGAALSRFAMKNDGGWMEGEVVERQRARVAYEDFLHRRQDPALLEQEAGNEFSARVFPIPARGRKELIVSYSHALVRSSEPYVLPLLGLAQVGRLDVRVLLGERPISSGAASNLGGAVSDRRVVELHKRDWIPDRDLEIAQGQAGDALTGAGRTALRHGNLALVRVEAPFETAADSLPQEIGGLYVLVDSSASRALGYAAQVRRLGELVEGLRNGAGGATPLGVAAFDQEVVSIYEGPASGFGDAELRALRSRRALGASDLGRALGWLRERLAGKGARTPRVLLISDGIATAGATETRELKGAVKALGHSGVERLDALAAGGLRDDAVLRELVTGNLPQDGQRIDGAAPLPEIARRLTLACRSGIPVAVEGATWVWPETLDGMQPGDEALVVADLAESRPLRVTVAGRGVQLGEPVTVERPLLERAWAQARIERLVHLREGAMGGDEDLRRALSAQIVEVSVKHRVLSPLTALLVLETEGDYARFGLDRRALADILTVGPGGLEVAARSWRTEPVRQADVAVPTEPRKSSPPPPTARREPAQELQPSAVLGPVGGNEAAPLRVGGEPEAVAPDGVGEDLAALGYTSAVAPSEIPSGVPGGVEGGVPGGVLGGVPGGVAGGLAAPPPPPAPRPATEAPAARERVDAHPSAPPEEPGEDRITVTAESPLLDERRIATGATVRPEDSEADEDDEEGLAAPYSGPFAEVMKSLAAGQLATARSRAEAWNAETPGDVLALLAMGEVWEAAGEKGLAARAYGSLIDLFPSRVDLRRLAGERLERLGEVGAELAIDTYRKAVADRPDHPSGHRLLAWALLKAGHVREAFEVLEKGIEQRYPGGRFAGVDRVLREDLGLLGAAWLRAEPGKKEEIVDRLRAHGSQLAREASLRFVLSWETDANDVDLHVYDRQGGHAYYGHKTLPSGGELVADVTTGYGPECFAVANPAAKPGAPYRLKVHYYSRGPMGYGMGTVQIVAHDGAGRLRIEPRPFVVMVDQARVDLGRFGEGRGKGKGKGK